MFECHAVERDANAAYPIASEHYRMHDHKSPCLKSDFNEVLFVLELRELLCKNIKITTKFIFKKGSTHKK